MTEYTLKTPMDDVYKRVAALEQNGIPGVRDFFATSALSVLANNFIIEDETVDKAYIAKYCYEVADAMMVERSKGGTKNPQ